MTSLDDLDDDIKHELSAVDACVIGFGIGALLAMFFMLVRIALPFLKGEPEL